MGYCAQKQDLSGHAPSFALTDLKYDTVAAVAAALDS